MSTIKSFEDLIVWQKSHELMLAVYKLVELLPHDEKYNRISQPKRSVSSISANISEGFGRFHYQENIQFCRQARGSLEETMSHVLAARDLKQAPAVDCTEIIDKCIELRKILNGYIQSIQRFKTHDSVT